MGRRLSERKRCLSLWQLQETFHKDLDYFEEFCEGKGEEDIDKLEKANFDRAHSVGPSRAFEWE